jgi:hypothetical protein
MVNLKELSYLAMFDKRALMSGRVSSALVYIAIRAGEIIDWWFPVKASAPLKTN